MVTNLHKANKALMTLRDSRRIHITTANNLKTGFEASREVYVVHCALYLGIPSQYSPIVS
jgi:hypothetical protein